MWYFSNSNLKQINLCSGNKTYVILNVFSCKIANNFISQFIETQEDFTIRQYIRFTIGLMSNGSPKTSEAKWRNDIIVEFMVVCK